MEENLKSLKGLKEKGPKGQGLKYGPKRRRYHCNGSQHDVSSTTREKRSFLSEEDNKHSKEVSSRLTAAFLKIGSVLMNSSSVKGICFKSAIPIFTNALVSRQLGLDIPTIVQNLGIQLGLSPEDMEDLEDQDVMWGIEYMFCFVDHLNMNDALALGSLIGNLFEKFYSDSPRIFTIVKKPL